MEDMMSRMTLSSVFIFTVIALQIKYALAFEWKNISKNIVACEHDDVHLIWEYDLTPGEYVKAKTWFTGENKTAKRIAYWKDTDGIKIEPAYTERITVTGDGNDSLILRRVTTSDEGIYTLIPSFPLSSNPDPRLALNLIIYVPPLQEKGCCKPDINATKNELKPLLYSEQGCGKPLPIMHWNISRNKMVRNGTLILGDNDRVGTYKVCLIGSAVDRCFKGNVENLCESYSADTAQTQTDGDKALVGILIGISIAILSIFVAVVLVILFRKRLQKARWTARELTSLLATDLEVEYLTKLLAHTYKYKPLFKKTESKMNLQTDICNGSSRREPDMDIKTYRNIFERNGQPLKRILIQGNVGCGKTPWCNTLTQEWRKAHDSENQESNDNILFLKEYKLLFNIQLAKMHKFETFNELLSCTHFSMFERLKIDVYDYIQEHNTIIIIQGLEKFTADPSIVRNILTDKGLGKAVFIITSTPLVWSRFSREISVDRIISLTVLKKDNTIATAQKMLVDDHLPQDNPDELLYQ